MIEATARAEMVRTLMALEFAFAMLPGFYGVFYILGQIWHRRWLSLVGVGFGLVQLAVTAIMLRTGYLDAFWSRWIVVVALAYFILPPALWKLAQAIHRANAGEV